MTKEASRIHLSFLLAGKEDFREMKKSHLPHAYVRLYCIHTWDLNGNYRCIWGAMGVGWVGKVAMRYGLTQ